MVKNKKHFSPLGTKLYFHVNSSKENYITLNPNMAALSRGCKPRDSKACGALSASSSYRNTRKITSIHLFFLTIHNYTMKIKKKSQIKNKPLSVAKTKPGDPGPLIGPLQLAILVVQNCHAGTQNSH